MPIALASISRCFQGDVPNVLATVSADGVPNVIYLSQVMIVDDDHVAISNQFLRKTIQNLAENPVATLLVIDPVDGESYKLLARHVRSENEGKGFEDARLALDSHGGDGRHAGRVLAEGARGVPRPRRGAGPLQRDHFLTSSHAGEQR